MKKFIKELSSISAAILSAFFSMLAHGYCTTVISIKLYEMGCNEWEVGFVSSAFYIGIILGSLKSDILINRIGHIRAYSAFASIVTCASLMCSIFIGTYSWFILRLISGISIAGIWIVIESWLLGKSNSNTRGKYFAIYMITVYAANSLGQLFLKISNNNYFFEFIITSIFFSFSILPLSITNNEVPSNSKVTTLSLKKFLEMNPVGIYGCFYAGMVLAVLYSIFPYYLQLIGFPKDQVGIIMFYTIFGGMIIQFPIGYISDILERKKVLFFLSIASILISFIMIITPASMLYYLPIVFTLGGILFSIYPVSMGHVCNSINDNQVISITQKLVLIYGVGNILGPFITPLFMNLLGPLGLFIFFITASMGCLLMMFFDRKKKIHSFK